MDALWLDPIPTQFRDEVVAKFLEERDVLGLLVEAGNEYALDMIANNVQPLKALGLYEAGLVNAFTATRINNAKWSLTSLRELFGQGDRARLLAAGDPLPGPGPFTIYRGVAGKGPARRVRGLSWTASVFRAWWFADRFAQHGILSDPAVFSVAVSNDAVYAYCNERHKEEFVVLLPPTAQPRRVAVDRVEYDRWSREREGEHN